MPAGKLSVSPLTIHGLDQNGFPNSQTFIGCYVSQSEKQRTNSAPGPQPQFKDTLSYNVTETSETLFLDVINEDPSHPGVIGSGQLPLKSVLDTGRFEDWVPLQSSNGGPLGHLYLKLSFSSSGGEPNPYDAPSTPTPNSDPRNLNSGQPQPAYPGAASSFAPPTPVAGEPPVATDPAKKPKKEIPDWMKYGGAAVAGAAAVGLGAWAVNALGSDDEEEDEEARQKAYEAQQQQSMMSGNAYDQPQESYGSRNFSGSDDAEAAHREEERALQEAQDAADRAERAAEEAEEAAEEAEEAASEASDAASEASEAASDAESDASDAEEAAEEAEEAAEEAEEAAEEAEEAAEEAEEAAEEAEEAAEEAEEAAEESCSSSDEEEEEESLVPNDCKWR